MDEWIRGSHFKSNQKYEQLYKQLYKQSCHKQMVPYATCRMACAMAVVSFLILCPSSRTSTLRATKKQPLLCLQSHKSSSHLSAVSSKISLKRKMHWCWSYVNILRPRLYVACSKYFTATVHLQQALLDLHRLRGLLAKSKAEQGNPPPCDGSCEGGAQSSRQHHIIRRHSHIKFGRITEHLRSPACHSANSMSARNFCLCVKHTSYRTYQQSALQVTHKAVQELPDRAI